MLRFLIIFVSVFLTVINLKAQDFEINTKPETFKKLNISGEYRGFFQQRNFYTPYILATSIDDTLYLPKRSILFGDATQLPELTLNIGATLSNNVAFGTDLTFWNMKQGTFDYFRGVHLGVNLYGSFKTTLGNFSLRTGGIQWLKMSRMTFKAFEGYNRYSLFTRNPWDPLSKDLVERYSQYFDRGAISQDERWGNQAFHGFSMSGLGLPNNFNLMLLYGKAQSSVTQFATVDNTTLQQSQQFVNTQFYSSLLPSYVIGGSLSKKISNHSLAFNSMNGLSFNDTIGIESNNYSVNTISFQTSFKKISVIGEIGYGKYDELSAGESIAIKFKTDKSLTYLPFDIEYFRVSPNFYNNNSEIINSSINEQNNTQVEGQGVLRQNGSAILGVGQLANNRTGLTINTEFQFPLFKINLGQTIAKEIQEGSNQLTYGRTVNGVTFSEFYRWQYASKLGPYSRLNKFYRGVYETVNLDEFQLNNNLCFNSVDFQIKHHHKINKHKYYIYYLGNYNTAQQKISPFIITDESALIRQYSHQLEKYFQYNSKLIFSTYLGYERVIGNYITDTDDETFMPRNQKTRAFGIGIDYKLSEKTSLFFRSRYFSFEDINFSLDKSDGLETTLEIKVNF